MNYQGKIYALKSNQTDKIYIGSTIYDLSYRKRKHIENYNRYIRGKTLPGKTPYISSVELCKYDDMYIELIEEYPCENKRQLEKREGELQREMNCVNKIIANRSWKEHAQESEQYRENRRKAQVRYREKHREKRNAKKREKVKCECGVEISYNSKARHLRTQKHNDYLINKNNIT